MNGDKPSSLAVPMSHATKIGGVPDRKGAGAAVSRVTEAFRTCRGSGRLSVSTRMRLKNSAVSRRNPANGVVSIVLR